MPWALLFRVITRLAFVAMAGRTVMRGRRPAYTTPGQAGPRAPGTPGAAGAAQAARARRIVASATQGARLVVRLVAAMVLLAGSATVGTAGATLTALGPRWVGIPLLVIAAVLLVMGAVEFRVVIRERWAMHRRAVVARLAVDE